MSFRARILSCTRMHSDNKDSSPTLGMTNIKTTSVTQTAHKQFPIRKAVIEDLASIVEIERISDTAAHWAESDYRKAIQHRDHLTLVAEQAGQVLGFLVGSTATQEWELENIAVAPHARRRGVGRALMLALISCAQYGGASEIRQEIRSSNSPAQLLGQSVGFVQEGRRQDYYRNPVEDALLFKYLVPPAKEATEPRE